MTNPQDTNNNDLQTNPVVIENLLIIGAGIMGSGIAQSSATSGKFKSIVLHDISEDQLKKAKESIYLSLNRARKMVPQINANDILSKITFTTELQEEDIGKGLLVIESVPEILQLKQNVFKNLYAKYGSNEKVILVTNTSALPCRKIGLHVNNKSRFAGLHFFNPVPVMKLIEVIRVDNGTNDITYNALVGYAKSIGKIHITCKDTPGFIVNRLLVPYVYDAVSMLDRGDASMEDIDIGMKLGLGHPMGPFEVLDFAGIDTAVHIGEQFLDEDGSPMVQVSETVRKLVREGKLGRKTGQGFYTYNASDGTKIERNSKEKGFRKTLSMIETNLTESCAFNQQK